MQHRDMSQTCRRKTKKNSLDRDRLQKKKGGKKIPEHERYQNHSATGSNLFLLVGKVSAQKEKGSHLPQRSPIHACRVGALGLKAAATESDKIKTKGNSVLPTKKFRIRKKSSAGGERRSREEKLLVTISRDRARSLKDRIVLESLATGKNDRGKGTNIPAPERPRHWVERGGIFPGGIVGGGEGE